MLNCISCNIKEINLKEAEPLFYKDNVFIYNMNLSIINGNNLYIDSMRLIEIEPIFVSTTDVNNAVIFRFININKYCRNDYRKFSDSYTEFIFHYNIHKLTIVYYTYFIIGDPDSKEIIDVIKLDVSQCVIIHKFLHFLFTKFKHLQIKPNANL